MSNFQFLSKVELSVRRKRVIGLPGDDVMFHKSKIGSSLKGVSALRGMSHLEEIKYLPDVIGISPQDNEWRMRAQEYWNNISVIVPSDGLSTSKLQGREMRFTVAFKNEADKLNFDKVIDFEEKVKLLKELHSKEITVIVNDEKKTIIGACEIVEGVSDYILFRYCLVYSKVANRVQDIHKSPKIDFYLYSKDTEIKTSHANLKNRIMANNAFAEIMEKESIVDAVLIMFNQNLTSFENLADKHLALEALIKESPEVFLEYMKDKNLSIKSSIKKAVEAGIIHNPVNSTNYYFGENNEIKMGDSVMDVVLFLQDEKNKVTKDIISTRLKNFS